MNYEIISIILSAISLIVVAVVAIYYAMSKFKESLKEKAHYDAEKQQAVLEILRRDYEKKIYDLTDRLLQTEPRWKDLNHVLISSQIRTSDDSLGKTRPHLSNFLKNFGLQEDDLQIEKDLVFMLTPFHEDMRDVYEMVSNVCKDVGLRCLRGDEDFVEEDLLKHIIKLLVKARIVVANINGRNPNVFYELGIAHAIDKPTIIIAKSVTETPFDVKSKQIIFYKNLNDLKGKIEKSLTKVLVKG